MYRDHSNLIFNKRVTRIDLFVFYSRNIGSCVADNKTIKIVIRSFGNNAAFSK